MLVTAVDAGYLEIVRFLVEEVGVQANHITRGGETALHRACYRNRSEIVMYLVEEVKVDIEICSKTQRVNYTPFCRACLGNRDQAL